MSAYDAIISGLKSNLEYLFACGIREIPVLHSAGRKAEILSPCEGCALKGEAVEPLPRVGAERPDVVFVLGCRVDESGGPFDGEEGALLEKIITDGMKYKKDEVAVCYAMRCASGEDEKTSAQAASSCAGLLMEDLRRLRPKAVIAMGPVAALSLAGSSDVESLRARLIEKHGLKLIVTYGPDVLVKNPLLKKDAWKDIKLVLNLLNRPK